MQPVQFGVHTWPVGQVSWHVPALVNVQPLEVTQPEHVGSHTSPVGQRSWHAPLIA